MKYVNNSGFKQLVMVAGKKELVGKGLVIEVDRELLLPGFDKVSDDTPITYLGSKIVKRAVSGDALTALQKKINDLENDTKATAQMAETQELAKTLESQVADLKKRTDESDVRQDIAKIYELIVSLQEADAALKSENALIYKRLEILKSVAKTLEYQVELLVEPETSEDSDNSFRQ